ncbi:hypothetical protein NU887_10335 [Aquiflexum sp. XJ19-11]|uniref:Uncharacterized protein n=2 Tax=Aquiflexum gelatinilyticum TaxID=2961943 RepID=A0A9X2P911_9BACT|nr:hypothetical protein [Aquiflexum gelatinilyticum]
MKRIKDIYESFLNNFTSVEVFFMRIAPVAENEDKVIEKERIEYREYILKEIFGEDFENRNKTEKLEIKLTKEEVERIIHKIKQSPKIPAKNYGTLTKGAFIMLNNYFEFLFSDLLTYNFKKNTTTIDSKKLNISFDDLKKYNSIEEAYEDLIYKEVESLLIEMNFEELKTYFSEKLKINLETEIINWNLITEIRERRNIIIHNNSLVNNKYISRSKNPFNFNLNDEVKIEKEYFLNALSEIKLAGVLLCLNCWGNWDKNDTTNAIKEIVDISFNNLKNSNHVFVEKICSYTEKRIKAKNDEEDDIIYKIKFNQCIALKRLNKLEELNLILSTIKTGALTPLYKIAHLTLNNRHFEAVELVEKAIVADDLTIEKYEDWPIFNEIRNDKKLHKKVLETFEKINLNETFIKNNSQKEKK